MGGRRTMEKGANMTNLNDTAASGERHEEAPNEFLLGRRGALIGLAGAAVTSVSALLSPAFAQRTFKTDNIKDAADVGDFLEKLPQCRLTTATVEGPYYIDQRIIRSDIRENQPGLPLALELRVANANASCRPVAGAVVSI